MDPYTSPVTLYRTRRRLLAAQIRLVRWLADLMATLPDREEELLHRDYLLRRRNLRSRPQMWLEQNPPDPSPPA